MSTKTFSGIILAGHKDDAIEVPFDPTQALGVKLVAIKPGRRGFPVRAMINSIGFDSHIVARSKTFWLLLPMVIERQIGVNEGDQVSVTLSAR
jgi:Domain of unknown function (DUF1905)